MSGSDAAASGTAATGAGDESSAAADGAATTGASSSTSPYGGMGSSMMGSSMYGSPYGSSMYGRSMYGGYGGGMYGGYGGGMYGMGGMYGGGMYGGGMGGGYADSMFRMTQMLEMNSIMLDQLQEHVSMTYNRIRDVATWLWALGDIFKSRPVEDQGQLQLQGGQVPTNGPTQGQCYESEEAKQEALQRVRQRVKVLLVMLGLFLLWAIRDNRRQSRNLVVDGAWLKAIEGLNLATPATSVQLPPEAIADRQMRPMGPGLGMGGMGGGLPF